METSLSASQLRSGNGATLREHLRIVGEARGRGDPGPPGASARGAVLSDLRAHDDEELRVRGIAQAERRDLGRATARNACDNSFQPRTCPCRRTQFVRVLHALSDGLLFLRFMQPQLMTDEVIIAAFEALAQSR